MTKCNGSSSAELDKAAAPEDDEFLNEGPRAKSRPTVLRLLCLSNERSDMTSTLRLL